MTERNTCRMPTCSTLSRERTGCAGRFCSDGCAVRYEHLQADARDQVGYAGRFCPPACEIQYEDLRADTRDAAIANQEGY
ncbi:hypothetical protein FYC77_19625 [Natrialba swarupiae]|uniref:Uncharacterized protein n=1 Tax=Natrialba swarupiae TaxID=2448032 RepID=A0A5D5AGP4_9EURY|nr:hypothetical protein FYC77_19625 [Natrialba swarupiae]